MIKFIEWIIQNWRVLLAIGLLIFLFGLIPTITQSLRSAKDGIKEATTPLGFFVMLILIVIFIIIFIYMKSIFTSL